MKTNIKTIVGIITAITTLALTGASFAQTIAERRAAARERAEAGRLYLNEQLAKAHAEALAWQAAWASQPRDPLAPRAVRESNPPPASPQALLGAASYGCGLWLEISVDSPTNLLLTLHNTLPCANYQILSKTNLAAVSWTVETNVAGASGQSDTPVIVPILQRPELFFIASESRDCSMTNFAGMNFLDTLRNPPDSMGAVGPSHFVELLNGRIAVYDKTSGALIASEWDTNFFALSTGPRLHLYDPRLLYDHQAHRWVATMIDNQTQNVILAVSHDDSPTNLLGNWTKHLISVVFPDHATHFVMTDFDTLGCDANGLYVSVWHNQVPMEKSSNTVAAIKKPEIYQGTNLTTLLRVESPGAEANTIQPAVNFDDVPADGFAWFVIKGPPDILANPYQGGAVLYRRLQWSGTNAAWADADWRAVPPPMPACRDYFDLENNPFVGAPQAGGTGKLTLYLGSRLAMAVIRQGFLYTCQGVGLSTNTGTYLGDYFGAQVDRSGVQWFKLQISTNEEPLTVYDHGRIYDNAAADPKWYYMASMMVNCVGDVAFGFSGSSSNIYISAYYAWCPASSSLPVIPQLIQPGLAYFNENRFGDYSYTSLDPIDGMTFWTVQEYAENPIIPLTLWGTQIAKIRPTP